MATTLENFNSAIDSITNKVTGADSIYNKTITRLNTIYTEMGMTQDEINSILAQVTGQLAVATTTTAITTAADIAKSTELIAAQVATEEARKAQVERQTKGFDDKLKVEVMKNMGGVGQMEATQSTTTAGTLLSMNKTMNIVYKAAGIEDEAVLFSES